MSSARDGVELRARLQEVRDDLQACLRWRWVRDVAASLEMPPEEVGPEFPVPSRDVWLAVRNLGADDPLPDSADSIQELIAAADEVRSLSLRQRVTVGPVTRTITRIIYLLSDRLMRTPQPDAVASALPQSIWRDEKQMHGQRTRRLDEQFPGGAREPQLPMDRMNGQQRSLFSELLRLRAGRPEDLIDFLHVNRRRLLDNAVLLSTACSAAARCPYDEGSRRFVSDFIGEACRTVAAGRVHCNPQELASLCNAASQGDMQGEGAVSLVTLACRRGANRETEFNPQGHALVCNAAGKMDVFDPAVADFVVDSCRRGLRGGFYRQRKHVSLICNAATKLMIDDPDVRSFVLAACDPDVVADPDFSGASESLVCNAAARLGLKDERVAEYVKAIAARVRANRAAFEPLHRTRVCNAAVRLGVQSEDIPQILLELCERAARSPHECSGTDFSMLSSAASRLNLQERPVRDLLTAACRRHRTQPLLFDRTDIGGIASAAARLGIVTEDTLRFARDACRVAVERPGYFQMRQIGNIAWSSAVLAHMHGNVDNLLRRLVERAERQPCDDGITLSQLYHAAMYVQGGSVIDPDRTVLPDDNEGVRSDAEARVFADLAALDVPSYLTNVRRHGFELDILVRPRPQQGYVLEANIELDGSGHRRRRHLDDFRDAIMARAGIVVCRLPATAGATVVAQAMRSAGIGILHGRGGDSRGFPCGLH